MSTSRKLSLLLSIMVLTLALSTTAKVQAAEGDIKTFLDSEVPAIKIQVNATAQTQPTKNLTVTLSLTTETNVSIENANLEIFGFLNGTEKLSMTNITDDNFQLDNASRVYSRTVTVPDWVWGAIYGEIRLTYLASLPMLGDLELQLKFSNVTTGFPMTQVENTFLENVQDQLGILNESYNQLTSLYGNLTSSFTQLNQTYWDLYNNYTSVQGSLGELDNTRRLTAVFAVTTVFFVATTIYLVFRRPKEYW